MAFAPGVVEDSAKRVCKGDRRRWRCTEVGGQGKAWNWWRQSVARRAPQRPSDLAVEFFHLLPVSCPILPIVSIFSFTCLPCHDLSP